MLYIGIEQLSEGLANFKKFKTLPNQLNLLNVTLHFMLIMKYGAIMYGDSLFISLSQFVAIL